MRDVDLTTVHYLSGPVGVQGREPGDLLVVDLLDIGARDDSQWGFNGFSAKNGGGFLTDHFPLAQKSIWDFNGMFTKFPPHCRAWNTPGLIHPGLIGCLPDKARCSRWNKREAELIATDPDRVPGANPLCGHALWARPRGCCQQDGRRRAAPCRHREHGGNCDIKDLSRGSRIFFPVYVDGGGLSVGDLHFSQGDGEITFCGAIEMAGWVHMRVNLIRAAWPSTASEPDLQAQGHAQLQRTT